MQTISFLQRTDSLRKKQAEKAAARIQLGYSGLSLIKKPTFLAWGKPVSYLGTLSACTVPKGNPFKLALGRGDRRRVDLGASFLFQGFLNKGQVTVLTTPLSY